MSASYAAIALKSSVVLSTAEAELERILKESPNMLRNFPCKSACMP